MIRRGVSLLNPGYLIYDNDSIFSDKVAEAIQAPHLLGDAARLMACNSIEAPVPNAPHKVGAVVLWCKGLIDVFRPTAG